MDPLPSPLPLSLKVRLAARVWWSFLRVVLRDPREPLPRFVERWGRIPHPRGPWIAPPRLRGAVLRALHLGPWRPSCLVNALVLYRLLHEQGDQAELVIGLPVDARDHEAHAWVELDGEDLGPFPGSHHSPLARFA